MQLYIDWLKKYFSIKNLQSNEFETINYFEAGMIDSLGVIDLIENVESNFKIRFNENHFQERRFSTIKGLAEIIDEIKRSSDCG